MTLPKASVQTLLDRFKAHGMNVESFLAPARHPGRTLQPIVSHEYERFLLTE